MLRCVRICRCQSITKKSDISGSTTGINGCGRSFKSTNSGSLLQISPEVQDALQGMKPVVALESTIITHGMPFPQNLRTALEVEDVCRKIGAVPATIGVIRGKIHVGMDTHLIEEIADTRKSKKMKISRRDFPFAISQELTGGTTTSGTMIASHMAGIQIFATGGVGGVHRGGENSMDVSADLTELGRTPIAVISAGIKSILDIGRTLEYLETQGVCVAAYNKTGDFPSFFTPTSGHFTPFCIQNAIDAAKLIVSRNWMKLQSGILIAVPIPDEHAPDGRKIEEATRKSLQEASEKGVLGKEVTPYVLQRVNELTGGESLKANIALIKNNAKVASEIAVELSRLTEPDSPSGPSRVYVTKTTTTSHKNAPVEREGIPVISN